MADVFDLTAKLTLDKSGYETNLNSAKNTSQNFGSSAKASFSEVAGAVAGVVTAVTAVVVAVGTTVAKFASFGDAIDKNSQKVGMTAGAYQEWNYALELAGTSMEQCAGGFRTLTNKMDDAKSGSASAISAFKEVGVSVQDLKTKSSQDIFKQVVNGLQNMEDKSKRAATANDLFGRSGQQLAPLLNMTASALDEAFERARAYGIVISDQAVSASAQFTDALTTLKMSIKGTATEMASTLMPALSQVIDGFTKIFNGDSSGEGDITEGIEGFIGQLLDMLPDMVDAGLTLMEGLGRGIVNALPELLDKSVEVILEIVQVLIKHLPDMIDLGVQLMTALAEGLIKAVPTLIAGLGNVLIEAFETLFSSLPNNLNGPSGDAGKGLVDGLSDGFSGAFPNFNSTVIGTVSSIGSDIKSCWTSIKGANDTLKTSFKNSMETIMNAIKPSWWDNALGAIGQAYTTYGSVMGSVGQTVITSVRAMVNNSSSSFNSMINNFNTGAQMVRNGAVMALTTAFDTIAPAIGSAMEKGATAFASAIDGLKSSAQTGAESVVSKVKEAFNKLPQGVRDAVSGLSTIVSDIVGFFANLPAELARIGAQAMQKFADAMADKWNSLYNKITEWAQKIIDKFNEILGRQTQINQSAQNTINGYGRGSSTYSSAPVEDMGYSSYGNAGVTYNQTINVNKEISTADELARTIRLESRYGLMVGTV